MEQLTTILPSSRYYLCIQSAHLPGATQETFTKDRMYLGVIDPALPGKVMFRNNQGGVECVEEGEMAGRFEEVVG